MLSVLVALIVVETAQLVCVIVQVWGQEGWILAEFFFFFAFL